MNGLLDLCGNPVDLSKVKDFRLGSVEYIYQPAYKETRHISEKTWFHIKTVSSRIDFYRMEPYGVVMGKYDGFDLNQYYPTTVVGAIAQQIALAGQSILDGIGDVVTDILHLNNVQNKTLQIRRKSGAVEMRRLRDIPVKLYYANGQIADVPKNSTQLPEGCAPVVSSIIEVPVLLVQAEKPIVIFGNGIDTDYVQLLYNALLQAKDEEFRQAEETKRLQLEAKKQAGPNLFGIPLPVINIQLPPVFGQPQPVHHDTEKNIDSANQDS